MGGGNSESLVILFLLFSANSREQTLICTGFLFYLLKALWTYEIVIATWTLFSFFILQLGYIKKSTRVVICRSYIGVVGSTLRRLC